MKKMRARIICDAVIFTQYSQTVSDNTTPEQFAAALQKGLDDGTRYDLGKWSPDWETDLEGSHGDRVEAVIVDDGEEITIDTPPETITASAAAGEDADVMLTIGRHGGRMLTSAAARELAFALLKASDEADNRKTAADAEPTARFTVVSEIFYDKDSGAKRTDAENLVADGVELVAEGSEPCAISTTVLWLAPEERDETVS